MHHEKGEQILMSSEPVRLEKVQENEVNQFYNLYIMVINRVEAWVLSHAIICLIVLNSMLIALFVVCIFLLTGVSATDSGVMYNSMEQIL
jgi:hypothetical protein